jgi:hypothetical protein
MFFRRVALLVVLAATALMSAPAGAGAATQVGQTFTPDSADTENPCFGGFTFIQSTSPSGQYAVPTAGVITSWSFAADSSPPQLKFKVGRSAGGEDLSIVGESALETPTPDQLNTYPARIAVQPGDFLGIYTNTTGDCVQHSVGYDYQVAVGDQTPGPPVFFGNVPGADTQFDISAIVEPDADQDGFGDETQDQCLGSPGPQNGCPVTTTPATNPTCRKLRRKLKHLRKKLQRQKQGLAEGTTEKKRSQIAANIKDTKKRLKKFGCK